MLKKRSLAEAKAKFSECIHEAERGEEIVLTRNGRPVAAIVPIGELAELRRHRAALPRGGLASLAGTLPDADDFLTALATHRRSGSRAVPEMD